MPTRKTRAGTSLRTRQRKDKLVELCLDMEDALDRVVDVAHAMRLIGHGLGHGSNQSAADEQEGRAVAAVASTACDRLDTLRQTWRNLCKFTLQSSKL
jgi:hypothetical protein